MLRKIEENEPEKLNLLLKTCYAEVKKRTKTVTATWKSCTRNHGITYTKMSTALSFQLFWFGFCVNTSNSKSLIEIKFLFSIVGYFSRWHKLFCTFHSFLWYILLLQHVPGFLPSPEHQAELFVVYSLPNGWKMHQINRDLPWSTSLRTDPTKATASRSLLFQQLRGIVLYHMPWSRPVYVDYSVKMASRETIRPVTQ